jgi:hypothetical protein
MNKWNRGVYVVLTAALLAGLLGWWWVAGDFVIINYKNVQLTYRNSRRVGNIELNRVILKQVLEEITRKEQVDDIVFHFEKYTDQSIGNSLSLLKGSVQSVGVMMCSKPVINKNGVKNVAIYASVEKFKEKYGLDIALDRTNNLILICLTKAMLQDKLGEEELNKLIMGIVEDKNFEIVKLL